MNIDHNYYDTTYFIKKQQQKKKGKKKIYNELMYLSVNLCHRYNL
jgi:hypothetical protein